MQRCRCAGLHHDIVPCHVGSTLTEKGHLGGNVGTGHRRIQQLAAAHADVVRNAYQQRDHDSGSCGGTGDGAQKRTCHTGKKNQHPHIVLVADDQTLGFVNQGRFGQPCTDDEHGYEHDHVRVDEAAKGLGRGLDLIAENFEVVCATDGQKACEAFDIGSYSIVLLDLMIPKITGMNVMKYIRQKSTVPIIIISAKDSDSDKTLGLGLGADDYITKPFSITEVMARIKANIRRNTEYAAVQPEQTKLVWGPLVMNLENHTVTKSGEIIELTAKEFDILRLLLENPQRVYTKAQIYSLIWNDAYMGDENAVNVHISRLRTKIEDDPRKPQVVITVWGIGYKLGEQK